MKLVEILARELEEWPEGVFVTQDNSGWVFAWHKEPSWDVREWVGTGWCCIKEAPPLATDHATAIVTREMWEAERNRVAAPKQWSGEGLPPIGTVCEYVVSERLACRVEITAHGRHGICFCEEGMLGENYVGKAEADRFRPIDTRTPREKWIEAVDNAIKDTRTTSAMIRAIYDAGLAKLPE